MKQLGSCRAGLLTKWLRSSLVLVLVLRFTLDDDVRVLVLCVSVFGFTLYVQEPLDAYTLYSGQHLRFIKKIHSTLDSIFAQSSLNTSHLPVTTSTSPIDGIVMYSYFVYMYS